MSGFALALVTGVVTLPASTEVPLETVEPLSSKVNVKGEQVRLRVAEDVVLNGQTVIPRGTEAVGQIADAQARGGMGTSGMLAIRPLYVTVRARTVRLVGAANEEPGPGVATVIGMLAVTPLLSGQSAIVRPGTRIRAFVQRTTNVPTH